MVSGWSCLGFAEARPITLSDYRFWLRAEYFVRHLLGDYRWNANITELDLEKEQSGGR